ncbi:bifunctional adenosylcobinamide kinase/adenosylcobinamide-phosphate guanylyltransferase [Epibacterium sp. SM1979]|uniref:Bifunctional adenosylcobalamin biosynthesis protein n=1 Tax=Tritonibacter litoralis TaxID=2662264 RepID=A0A843YIV6_9RHOB|nr:bifunctional adenosylcobinamide kinase/adenosylcobinamide-phosphate guanylyltransferase [Tritonibacter litoralis]MQQ09738.1 bifunctional adenosylcobinamide kinase/adenosylcobinamide-phosphate guanylyltransferase [Tritonibacter litoralis]
MSGSVTLILGGAASGKSKFAEEFCANTGKEKIYWATSQIFDDEMRAKLARHIAQRGPHWTTLEEAFSAKLALSGLNPDQICLMDCATMWLTNHLLADHALTEAEAELFAAMDGCCADLVIVSNETGMGIVPENALARRFREAQGRLNIALAERAERVILVAAGLPLVMKGRAL